MGYRSIVISSAVRLSVKNRQLIIEGEATGTVPIEDIRTLMIESRAASITTYALSMLSEEGVCVYICDEKHLPSAVLQPIGRYSRQRKQIMTQIGQSKPTLKRLWQDIVEAKITNQAICLALCGVDAEYAKQVGHMVVKVQSGDATNVEGQAAALYFPYLFGYGFTRNEENGINAALNYGYAIVRGYIARTLSNYGFEPCIGIHHHSELNNYNLADDLIEPFRPMVDLFVYHHMEDEEMSPSRKRELCNILNYEMLSGGERHSMAYAIERLVHSFERCLYDDGKQEKLLLPTIEALKRHEYE